MDSAFGMAPHRSRARARRHTWSCLRRAGASRAPRAHPPTKLTSPPSSSTNTSPCSSGDIVPASTLMYGSVPAAVANRQLGQGGRRRGPCHAPSRPPAMPREAHAGAITLSSSILVPIFRAVTRSPQAFRSTPIEEAVTPLPRPLTTPPVTRTYFMLPNYCGQIRRHQNGCELRRDCRAADPSRSFMGQRNF